MSIAFDTPPRRGWRVFRCPDCGHWWEEASRDALSPSGDGCPMCYAWVEPSESRLDPSLAVDASFNLTAPLAERVRVIARGRSLGESAL